MKENSLKYLKFDLIFLSSASHLNYLIRTAEGQTNRLSAFVSQQNVQVTMEIIL